jgi:outer membrane lipoprotein SlyB
LAACSTPDSNTYTSRDVGQLIETSQGRVLSSRPVEIESDEGGVAGPLAGGAIGGAAGYGVGSGSGQGLATFIGAAIGAGLGYLAEKEIRSQEGIEYIVELEDGRVVTLVQNRAEDEPPIPDGEPVLVQFGSQYTRISQLNTDGASGGAGAGGVSGWTNPDTAPAASDEGGGAQDVSEPPVTSEPQTLYSGQESGQQD